MGEQKSSVLNRPKERHRNASRGVCGNNKTHTGYKDNLLPGSAALILSTFLTSPRTLLLSMSGLIKRLSNLGNKKSDKSTASSSTAAPAPAPATAINSTPAAAAPAAASTTPASATTTVPATTPAPAVAAAEPISNMSAPKIAVIYHSLWGHIYSLVEAAVAGLKESGADVTVFTFPETLSEEALGKMYANVELGKKYPNITAEDLPKFDGFVFAFGTRYGRAPAQASAFFDRTGGLWASGALIGKMATVITSAASQHGGHETTALTTVPFFAHQGIIYVPLGFQVPSLQDNSSVQGGSAYGATTISNGDGSRQVTDVEKDVSKKHGAYFGKVVGQYHKGK